VTIKIDVSDREKSSGFIVKGRIRRADGSPFAGAIVHAFEKDLRSEEPPGEAKTDKHGKYEINLTGETGWSADKRVHSHAFSTAYRR